MESLVLAVGTWAQQEGREAAEVISMREKLHVLRDVMITLSMQLVFRATILLRHWA